MAPADFASSRKERALPSVRPLGRPFACPPPLCVDPAPPRKPRLRLRLRLHLDHQLHPRQAHGADCTWLDDYKNSAQPVPGCPACKDQGATEPLLNCSYALGPGAHVSGAESFVSFRVELARSRSSASNSR